MAFDSLGLSKDLQKAVALAGYGAPTAVQARVIPLLLQGRDVLGQSRTGSGKTAAFVLPLLQRFAAAPVTGRRVLRTLILTPTRELAIQVANVLKVFGRALPRPPRAVLLVGGLNIDLQIRHLHHGADIAVATPGRLLDIIRRQAITFATLEMLVVDEADRMFDRGFAEDLHELLKAFPEKRQNALFSATLNDNVLALTREFMRDPVTIVPDEEPPTVATIQQRAIAVNRESRGPLLRHLITAEGWTQVLVFTATVRGADMLAAKLIKAGITANALHGGMTQAQRGMVLQSFKAKKITVLVATDILARGIDIDNLPVVVNYDLPRSPNDHIHRIGRTARAGQSGVAVSFIGHEDAAHFKLIERRLRTRLPRESIKGFELKGEPLPEPTGLPPVKGHRMSKKDKARLLSYNANNELT